MDPNKICMIMKTSYPC